MNEYSYWYLFKEASWGSRAELIFYIFMIVASSLALVGGVYSAVSTHGEPRVRTYIIEVDDADLADLEKFLSQKKDTQ